MTFRTPTQEPKLLQMLVEIGRHPMLMHAVQAYADVHTRPGGQEQVAQIIAEVETSATKPMQAHLQGGASNSTLDEFMGRYCRILEQFGDKHKQVSNEVALDLARHESEYERHMRNDMVYNAVMNAGEPAPIEDSAKQDERQGSNSRRTSDAKRARMCSSSAREYKVLTNGDEAEIQRNLKQRFAGSIIQLKLEFLKRRKKGKLPSSAKSALRLWWSRHILWPYPSEDDKKTLHHCSGLSMTQINNWFINQRKRHWHKIFPGGPPNTPEEATNALKVKYGSLKAALLAINTEESKSRR